MYFLIIKNNGSLVIVKTNMILCSTNICVSFNMSTTIDSFFYTKKSHNWPKCFFQFVRLPCDYDKDLFMRDYVENRKPVMLLGCIDKWKAKEWTLEGNKSLNNQVFCCLFSIFFLVSQPFLPSRYCGWMWLQDLRWIILHMLLLNYIILFHFQVCQFWKHCFLLDIVTVPKNNQFHASQSVI